MHSLRILVYYIHIAARGGLRHPAEIIGSLAGKIRQSADKGKRPKKE
jgi:hypothetical protein